LGTWNDILDEAKKAGSTNDLIRRKYLKRLRAHTNRNIIANFSAWLQKPFLGNVPAFSIGDSDMTGFMASIHKLKPETGLDLILHTPGGSLAATEAVVTYLRKKFGHDIRAIVPQLAMSAGTMMALASEKVIMEKHSSLGPIDPQVNGVPAHGIIEEFDTAVRETGQNNSFWTGLKSGMLAGQKDGSSIAKKIVDELGDHAVTKSHDRHYSIDQIERLGVRVSELETDNKLQDLVLSYHHAAIQTFASSNAVKIIENHREISYIEQITVNKT